MGLGLMLGQGGTPTRAILGASIVHAAGLLGSDEITVTAAAEPPWLTKRLV
jgi:hypothetical protein